MITLLLAAATVSFPGGTANDLAHFLRDNTNKDAFIVQAVPTAGSLKPLDFDPASSDAMNTLFRSAYDLRIIPGSDPTFTDEKIPMQLLAALRMTAGTAGVPEVRVPGSFGQTANKTPFPGDALKDGKITLRTKGKDGLDLSSLTTVDFGKPVTLHWVYVDDVPFLDVRDSTPVVFLQRLAKAIGARYHESNKEYNIEFSPEEFRRRALRSLATFKTDSSSPAGQMFAAKIKLATVAMQAMSSQELTTLFASPSGRMVLPITSQNGLATPAMAYLTALGQMPQDTTAQVEQTASTNPRQQGRRNQQPNQGRQVAMVLRSIDPNRVSTLTIDARFQTQLDIAIVDRQGRSAGTVRF